MVAADRHPSPTRGKRPPAYSMRALGRRGLPRAIVVDGARYLLDRTVKHDFWAATGFYVGAGDGRRVVLKVSRTEPFMGFALEWLGRWLCRREVRFYATLADLPNVPPLLGRVGGTGFVHGYADGRPLARALPTPDGFFDRLVALLREMHRRDVAYVDAHKPQNILVGADGRPYLVDFQISWDLAELGDWWLNRWWLRRLQHEDLYHALKHKKRMRPDETTPEELAIATRKSVLIRLHRFVTAPYFKLRRTTFARLRASGRLLPEGSK
jgi:hypothetical protein